MLRFSPYPHLGATVSAQGRLMKGAPFPASATAEGRPLNGAPSPLAGEGVQSLFSMSLPNHIDSS